ncbi:RNA-directed DNA polymerase [Massilia sp. LMS1-1-1.1]
MKKYILNRPVNALRKGYDPAFLGAKIRAKNPSAMQAAIIERSIQKKLNSSEHWNYKKYSIFKGINSEGKLEYRRCLTPSPTTAAAEAFLINEISLFKHLISPPNVFSYRIANHNTSSNYKYFLPEYEARNKAILSCLTKSQDHVAVFFDIEKFYPSVNIQIMIDKLKKFHLEMKQHIDLKVFVDFSIQQLMESPSGLPVGTEVSHLLANILLRDFDKKLCEKFGDKFFRYVDDITIVCHRSEIETTKTAVNALISELGLSPNHEKEEVYSLLQWESETNTNPIEGEDFFNYCQLLENWLKTDLSRFESTRRNLRDEGFHIPLEKIIARSWANQNRGSGGLKFIDIMSRTKALREKYRNAALDIRVDTHDHTRGSLQKARRAINPLFYLLDTSEYHIISDVAGMHPKLTVQREVSNAVISNDCTSLIDYPGSTVSSYCEIWKTVSHSIRKQPVVNTWDLSVTHRLDAFVSLHLHNVIPSSHVEYNHSILFALREGVVERTKELSGFEKEIESLRINLDASTQEMLLGRRETDGEDLDMQALELGDQMISS